MKKHTKMLLSAALAWMVLITSIQPVYAADATDAVSQESNVDATTAQDPDVVDTLPEMDADVNVSDDQPENETNITGSSDPEEVAAMTTDAAEHTSLFVTNYTQTDEWYGADQIIQLDATTFIFLFLDAATCEAAYEHLSMTDAIVEYNEQVESYEITDQVIREADKIEHNDALPLSVEDRAEETKKEKAIGDQEVTVAVIDTGIDANSEILQDRLIHADNITDESGHGTMIAEIIAANTDAAIKILPIKAFDENGHSTVGALYTAIYQAWMQGADVINISAAGLGTSPGLSRLIGQVNAAGVKVVVAAGNSATDAASYVPANCLDAITVAATDNEKLFATYSNYGNPIDFSAAGCAVRTEDRTEQIYVGTSIATANVTSYVAMILQNNPDADVEANLKESAEDLGDAGWDAYYGNGFLSIDQIVSTITKDLDDQDNQEQEITVEDLPEEEADIDLYSAAVRDNLTANGDCTINLSSDIELTNLSTGTGNKTINGNGHVIYLRGSDVLIKVGLFSHLTLNGCVIDGSRTYDNSSSGGTTLVAARLGRVDASFCTFQNNYANYGNSAYVSTMLDCTYAGSIYASFCTFQYGYGNGFCINNYAGDPVDYSQQCVGNAFGCTAHDIATAPGFSDDYATNNGNGFANSLGKMNLVLCTAYSCTNGIVFNGVENIISGCDTYNCHAGVLVVGGGNNTINAYDDGSGNLASSHIFGNMGIYFVNGTTVGAILSYISGIEDAVYIRSGATFSSAFCVIENYDDNYYLSNNRDLQNAYAGMDYITLVFTLRQHWCKYGLNEGRVAGTYNGNYKGNGVYIESGTYNQNAGTSIKYCYNGVAEGSGNYSTNAQADIPAYVSNCVNGLVQFGGGSYINEYAKIYNNAGHGIYMFGGYGHVSGAEICNNSQGGIRVDGGTYGMLSGSIHHNASSNVEGFGVRIADNGHFCMSGGSIYNNGSTYGRAIENRGVSGMAGGTIYNQYYGIRNLGTFTVSHGNFDANTYRARYQDIANNYAGNDWGAFFHWLQYGIYEGRDGGTSNNSTINASFQSIYNNGTFTSLTGKYYATNSYNVYQNGTYRVGGDAQGWKNGIYLTAGHNIDIISPLTCADNTIKVIVRSDDVPLGRLVAYCSYDMSYNTAYAMNKKFVLISTPYTSSGTNRTAYLRAANARNGGYGNIILSEQRFVSFDPNLAADGLTFALPTQVTAYWKEDVVCPVIRATAYYNGTALSSLVNVGWNRSAAYNSTAYPATATFTVTNVENDTTLYALWDTDMDLYIDGNQQSTGENYIMHHVSKSTPLPENTFTKTTVIDSIDPATYETVQEDLPYSFEGWCARNDAIYKDTDVSLPGQKLDTVSILIAAIQSGSCQINEDGTVQVTMYVVWDQFPVIDAVDIYCTLQEARENLITEKMLLKYAKATDLETIDETNTDGQIFSQASKNKDNQTFCIIDYDANEFLALQKDGAVSVTFCATDGAGNQSFKRVMVHVVDAAAQDVTARQYTRFITEKYYNASEDAGGLEEDSIWRTNDDYVQVIQDTFDRINADNPIRTYNFTHQQILDMKDYVDQHGIGNLMEDDALHNFINKFM